MRLFYIKTNIKSPANALIFPPGKIYDAVYGYSVAGSLEKKDLPGRLVAKCQDGVSKSDISSIDYFRSFGGIPIFSNKFLALMTEVGEEIEYCRMLLVIDGEEFELNIGRILNRTKILDYEKSGVGSGDFSSGTYFLKDMDHDFSITREINPLCHSVFVVSEAFVNLARKNKINAMFKEVAYS